MAPLPQDSVSARRRRRWLLRGVMLVALVGALGYATLPLWFPADLLGRRIAQELTAELGRTVEIGRVQMSWADGVTIESIRVMDGNPGAVLVEIEELRSPFQPITTLITGRVERIDIARAQVFLEADREGRFNVADLAMQEGGGFPSHHFRIGALDFHVTTPDAYASIELRDLMFDLVPDTGMVRASGHIQPQNPDPDAPIGKETLSFRAEFTVAQLKNDVPLQGLVRFDWNHLQLTDLPVALVSDSPVEQVEGTTDGTVTFTVQIDRTIQFEGAVHLNGVRTRWRGDPYEAWIPRADLQARGAWNLDSQRLAIHSLNYESDVLAIQAAGGSESPAWVSFSDERLASIRVACQIKQWKGLMEKWPRLAETLDKVATRLDGGADAFFDFHWQDGRPTLEIDLDATRTAVVCGPPTSAFLDAASGELKRVHVRLQTDPDDSHELRTDLNISIGGLALRARNRFPIDLPAQIVRDEARFDDTASLERALLSGGGELELLVEDLRAITTLSPWVNESGMLPGAEGPARLRLSVQPVEDVTQVAMALEADETSSLAVSDWFDKRAGHPFRFEASAQLPADMVGQVREPTFELHHGRGRLILDGPKTRVDLPVSPVRQERPDGAPIPMEIDWYVPLRIEHVEDLLEVLPAWRIESARNDQRIVAGDVNFVLAGTLSAADEGWAGQATIGIEADALAVRWDDVVDKPADRPFALDVSWIRSGTGRSAGRGLIVNMRQDRDMLRGQAVWTEKPDGGSPSFDHVLAEVNVSDVTDWLSLSPRLAEGLPPERVSGAIRARLESMEVDGNQQFGFGMDATELFFEDASSGLRKPAGAPARLRVALAADSDGDDAADDTMAERRVWKIVSASGQFLGLSLDACTGTFGLSRPVDGTKGARWGVLPLPGRVSLDDADLALKTSLSLDSTWGALHPALDDWMQTYALQGQSEGTLNMQFDANELRLEGVVRGDAFEMTANLQEGILDALRKEPDVPAAMHFDMSARLDEQADHIEVDIASLLLTYGANNVGFQGRALLGGPYASVPVGLADADLFGYVVIEDAQGLFDAVRMADIDAAEGSCRASLNARYERGSWSIVSGLVDFDQFRVDLQAEPLLFHGVVSFAEEQLHTEQFTFRAVPIEGGLSGHVQREEDGFSGRIGVALRELDVQGVRKMLGLHKDDRSSEEPLFATSPADAAGVDALLSFLQGIEAIIEVNADRFKVVLPPQQYIDADNLAVQVRLNRGSVFAEFYTIVDGGNVQGTIATETQETEPTLHLTYRAEAIQPGPVVDGYLQVMFPGMTATGPLTIIEESYHRLGGQGPEPVYGTGHGEFIIEGGWLEGRAAPLAVTRIFPGLNLARFDFTYMRSWFTMLDTGRVEHQMIFQGRFYHMYMVGHSDPDGRFRYEVGIDFFADFESRYWAEVGQGRIPLFTKDGRMDENGELVEERVRYMTPDRIFTALFVQNNLVVTAYHMVRKRVRGEP